MGLAKGSSSRWVGGCIGGDSRSFSPQTPGGAGSPGPAWLQGSSRDGLEKQGPPSLLTCNYVHLNLPACQGCTWNPTCLKESWPGKCRHAVLCCSRFVALLSLVGRREVRLSFGEVVHACVLCSSQNMVIY